MGLYKLLLSTDVGAKDTGITPCYRLRERYSINSFIKENIAIQHNVPKHGIIHQYHKRFRSIPADGEQVNRFYWKCKYFEYTSECSTND